jgi:hypothetical protein
MFQTLFILLLIYSNKKEVRNIPMNSIFKVLISYFVCWVEVTKFWWYNIEYLQKTWQGICCRARFLERFRGCAIFIQTLNSETIILQFVRQDLRTRSFIASVQTKSLQYHNSVQPWSLDFSCADFVNVDSVGEHSSYHQRECPESLVVTHIHIYVDAWWGEGPLSEWTSDWLVSGSFTMTFHQNTPNTSENYWLQSPTAILMEKFITTNQLTQLSHKYQNCMTETIIEAIIWN